MMIHSYRLITSNHIPVNITTHKAGMNYSKKRRPDVVRCHPLVFLSHIINKQPTEYRKSNQVTNPALSVKIKGTDCSRKQPDYLNRSNLRENPTCVVGFSLLQYTKFLVFFLKFRAFFTENT